MLLIDIFCDVDDFCKSFVTLSNKNLLTNGKNLRKRVFRMSLSEIMTIQIWFHFSSYKTFKEFYEKEVMVHLRSEFPDLVSYNRFIELKKFTAFSLTIYINLLIKRSKKTKISFIDSFTLKVCHPRRIHSHKTFKKLARRGKTSMGWFYGFKLHLVINHYGEIVAFSITAGNVADNNEKLLFHLTKNLSGKVYGDKGYIINPNLFERLYRQGVHIVTKIRNNMKNKLMLLVDKMFLKKRGVIESVGSVLKQGMSIEHSRHRSPINFLCHVTSAIIAYCFRPQKPHLAFFGHLLTVS